MAARRAAVNGFRAAPRVAITHTQKAIDDSKN
jgi:hypothetical protein